jgi:hypothetical protein
MRVVQPLCVHYTTYILTPGRPIRTSPLGRQATTRIEGHERKQAGGPLTMRASSAMARSSSRPAVQAGHGAAGAAKIG